MLNILQIVFAIITVSLSAYLLITRDYDLTFLMVFFSDGLERKELLLPE
ncbi:hypothetical protein [Lysinibacillus sp. BSL11]